MAARRAAVLLLFATSICCAAGQLCPTEPGAARAACFCQTVTEFRYYADTANGCTGAMWCYGPGQSSYLTCSGGLLFSDTRQYCDWSYNVQCSGPPPTPSPSPSPTVPTPTPSPSPQPSTAPAAPSPSPQPSSSCGSYASPGGKCGGANKVCCPSGQCCSKSGWCGITTNHCGTGCQPTFGTCSGSTTSPSPSPKVSPSPSPKPSPSPSPKPPSSPSPSPLLTPSPSPSPPPSPSPSPPPPSSPSPSPPAGSSGLLPSGPIVSVYYQSWSAPWASKGADLDLAKMPSYTNVIIVSFAKPDCSYSKGSLNLAATGLQFSSTGGVVREAIAALKAAQPNSRVLLAVGGATYTNFAALNTACIKGIVEDFGFDGVDLDYEPTNSNCQVKSTGVTCATDAESVSVTTALRTALPQGQYLLSTASWHVGAYGEGAFKNALPASQYTGVNLAMSKSAAGQALDLINIMAYDAGNKMSTGFDWSESYRAHRAAWPNQAIALGVEIPPEAWGGNILTLPEVTTRALYARDYAGPAPYGLMLWSIHKPGCPSAQQITSAACSAYSMPGCSTPLPQPQSSCAGVSPPPPSSTPSPPPAGGGASPSPSPPAPPSGGGSCSVFAGAGGACGAGNGGACCSNGQCCSQYGWCGITSGHCDAGCQSSYGACSGSPPPPTASPSPPPPAGSSPAPPPSQGGTGSVSDYISDAQFEAFFMHRNDPACASNGFYTYSAFLAAAAAFPGFGTSSLDPSANRRELAAFLGQISHETTGGWPTAPDGPYSWGLCWINEGGTIPPTAPYCAATPEYPCAPGKQYYGRGPMQLSWNYNYIQAGQALGFDGLNSPELVAQDAVLAFKTAVWFWMTPQAPKPSCHDIMQGLVTPTAADLAAGRLPGFGLTTNVINGGLECGSGTPKAQELDRIGYYRRYCDILGVAYGDNLDCASQQHY